MTHSSIKPSFFLELKALLMHFKYVYLNEQETLSVIIGSHLTDGKKRTSCQFLEKNREAIGWTMTDIKGLSPAIVQHRIYLNEEATPKRDLQ